MTTFYFSMLSSPEDKKSGDFCGTWCRKYPPASFIFLLSNQIEGFYGKLWRNKKYKGITP